MTKEEFELQRQQAVQNALNALTSSNSDELKLESGNNNIRILPRMNADGTRNFQFWNTVSVHWSVGPQSRAVACGRQFGDSCVICEHIQQLRTAGNVAQADEMKAKDTHLVGVEPANEPGATKYVRCAPTVMEGILKYANDPNWGCPADPENGYQINISKSGKGQKGTKYQVQAAPVRSALSAEVLQNLPDLTQAFPRMTREQVQALLYGNQQQSPPPVQGGQPPVLNTVAPNIPAPPPQPSAAAVPPPAVGVAAAVPSAPTPAIAPPPPPSVQAQPATPPGVTGAEAPSVVVEAPPFQIPPQT